MNVCFAIILGVLRRCNTPGSPDLQGLGLNHLPPTDLKQFDHPSSRRKTIPPPLDPHRRP